MLTLIRKTAASFAIAAVLLGGAAHGNDAPVSPAAQRVAHVLDSLQVERHWPAGVHVDWRSGEPDGGDGHEDDIDLEAAHCLEADIAEPARRGRDRPFARRSGAKGGGRDQRTLALRRR